jgi:hypothetical protein
MRVFVSSQVVDRWPARELIAGLRQAGLEVEHSPSNPLDSQDPRWANWYGDALEAAVDRCDLFIVVLEPGWDSSTWMAIEADAGLAKGRRTAERAYVWNPDGIVVRAAGMIGYLRSELPRDLAEAVARVRGAAV